MQAREKGTDLERAIALIEKTILDAVLTLSDKSYKIYSPRIITVDGVKHEIDIWVEFDIGGGYKSIFIFEAKNWQKNIGKNHLIIFSKKIEAAQAQRGFFVAKSLTKYALAAATLDPRITVLKVKQEFINSEVISRFHHIARDMLKTVTNLEFVPKTIVPESESKVTAIDIQNPVILLNGAPISCKEYLSQQINLIVDEHTNHLATNMLPDGTYSYDIEKEIIVAPDDLVVNGLEIGRIKFRIRYYLDVVRPAIVSKYEVETRGRIYTFDAVKVGDAGAAQLTIIETLHNNT
jgi:hypothetical protein